MTTYIAPGRPGSPVEVQEHYDNFIGGKWLPPVGGEYMPNLSPATAAEICKVAKSSPEDVDAALDAAHVAKVDWAHVSQTDRCRVLEKIADAIEANKEMLAVTESWETVSYTHLTLPTNREV